jgi:SAM-dependent methyltransferase
MDNTKIKWKTTRYVFVGKHKIPSVYNLEDGYNQSCGIKTDHKLKLFFKAIIWPLLKLRNDLFCDGFIEWEVGRLIKKYVGSLTVFLEIGCGDMSLSRFLPVNIIYNAFDLMLSEFNLRRVLKSNRNINIALASATNIPVESNEVSMVVSTEVFEHIPEIGKAVREIHRILKPNAVLICSIPNNYCYKYQKKGPHSGHINNWTFDDFIKFMESYNNFKFLEGFMKGFWIPLPIWLTKTSYQLPISSEYELYNTNFFYVFRAIK